LKAFPDSIDPFLTFWGKFFVAFIVKLAKLLCKLDGIVVFVIFTFGIDFVKTVSVPTTVSSIRTITPCW
jgi:hypothetical protein